jgi:hypothetical protein
LSVNRHAHNEHGGYTFAGELTLGAPLYFGNSVEFTPVFSFDYDYLHQKGYHEHGANSLNLKIHSKNADLMRGVAGFRVTRRCIECEPEPAPEPAPEPKRRGIWCRRFEKETGNSQNNAVVTEQRAGITWVPTFQFTVIREWRSQGGHTSASFVDQDCVFRVKGLNPDRTLVSPAVGLTAVLGNGNASMSLDYKGEFDVSGKFWDQNGSFQVSINF